MTRRLWLAIAMLVVGGLGCVASIAVAEAGHFRGAYSLIAAAGTCAIAAYVIARPSGGPR